MKNRLSWGAGSKGSWVSSIVVVAVTVIARIAFIEADVPEWARFNYQPIDEPYYCWSALNLYLFGKVGGGIFPGVPGSAMQFAIFGNIVSYLSFNVFGANFYGMRGAPLFAFSATAVLITRMFWKASGEYWSNDLLKIEGKLMVGSLAILVLAIATFEPSMMYLGLFNESTVFRLLGAFLTLWWVMEQPFTSRPVCYIFGAGFLAGANIFFVYPTNLFLVPFVLSVPLATQRLQSKTLPEFLVGLTKEKVIVAAGLSVAGLGFFLYKSISSAYGLYEIPLGPFMERVSLEGFRINFIRITGASAFIENKPLFYFFGSIFVASFFRLLLVPKSRLLFLSLVFTSIFFLQCLFVNDYPLRKMNFLVVQLMALSLAFFFEILSASKNSIGQDEDRDRLRNILNYRRFLAGALLVSGLVLTFVLDTQPIKLYHEYNLFFYTSLILLFCVLGKMLGSGKEIVSRLSYIGIFLLLSLVAMKSLTNYNRAQSSRSYIMRENLREAAVALPKNSIVMGWAAPLLVLGGARVFPFGNPYVWSYHPKGDALLAQSMSAVTSKAKAVFFIGDEPVSFLRTKFDSSFTSSFGSTLVLSFEKHPLSSVLPGNRRSNMEIYRFFAK